MMKYREIEIILRKYLRKRAWRVFHIPTQ